MRLRRLWVMSRHVWTPTTYADVVSDVDAHRVTENHYVELKRNYELTDAAKRKMAEHLAALALDGGVLIAGVEEDDLGRAVEVVPVDLAGLAERIDSAALYRCDPPVEVKITLLSNPEHDTTGILLVEVPAHPLAPIMVDGRYFGRGERAARRLSDAEVVRLHQARALESKHAEQALEAAVKEARADLPQGKIGRLTIIAEPAPIREVDAMSHVYAENDWWRWQQEADDAAAKYVQLHGSSDSGLADCLYLGTFSPLQMLSGGTRKERQPRGVEVRGAGRGTDSEQSGYLQLLESGALRLAINNFITLNREYSSVSGSTPSALDCAIDEEVRQHGLDRSEQQRGREEPGQLPLMPRPGPALVYTVWVGPRRPELSVVVGTKEVSPIRRSPMRILLDAVVWAGYGQFYLCSDDGLGPEMIEAFAGQSNGLCGAGCPGELFLMIGPRTTAVPMRIEVHDELPPVEDSWRTSSRFPTPRRRRSCGWPAARARATRLPICRLSGSIGPGTAPRGWTPPGSRRSSRSTSTRPRRRWTATCCSRGPRRPRPTG